MRYLGVVVVLLAHSASGHAGEEETVRAVVAEPVFSKRQGYQGGWYVHTNAIRYMSILQLLTSYPSAGQWVLPAQPVLETLPNVKAAFRIPHAVPRAVDVME